MHVTRISSMRPAERWEDAMISGNGETGIMVMGRPLDETIIVNHEKLWVVGTRTEPRTPDLAETWREARALAFAGRYRDASELFNERRRSLLQPILEEEGDPKAGRLRYDHIHPGLQVRIETDSSGPVSHYRRETRLDTGEVSVRWQDTLGTWERTAFVSRPDDAIVVAFRAPMDEALNCRLRLSEAWGKGPGEMQPAVIRHVGDEMFCQVAYAKTMGRPGAEGYRLLARVIAPNGRVEAVEGQEIDVRGVDRLLVIMRLEYLADATVCDDVELRAALAELPANYDALLARHAAVHGEMFGRVTLDLGSADTEEQDTETLIADGIDHGASPRLLETLHAVGRYAWICGGTGELPVALSGIWGNEWRPPWDGRYTFDANINLSISGMSQGALPEAIESFCRYIERSLDDWRYNARQIFGCRGILPDLCQGWRHGKALMLYPWVGGAGWLVSYLFDHYRYTRDQEFLRQRVLPILEETARFYEDFLQGTEDAEGRVRLYPSVSPENFPIMADAEQASSLVPNATCDIAICREALSNVLEACRELDIESEETQRWKALLERLPEYMVNQDGALAEWAWPGAGDRYNHRHSSHLYPLWPSLEFSPERTPARFRAVRRAVEKRLEAGLGNKSSHGYMHLGLVAARLRDPALLRRVLDDYARQRFLNSSMITCHNPGLMIYNLDGTFTLPSILTKMLLHSERGRLVLLPSLPADLLPTGNARGLQTRGGVKVEQLQWNLLNHRLVLELRAEDAHRLVLDCPHNKLRSVRRVGGDPDEVGLTGGDRTEWSLDLPAGQSVRLLCML